MPSITINESGFVLDGPLVAGEPAAVSVSGLTLAEGAALTLTCTARFPDALLASVQLTPSPWGFADGLLEAAQSHFADAPWAEDSRLEAVQGTNGSYDVWLVGEGYEPGDFDHGTTIAAATLSTDGLALVMASGMPFAVAIVPVGSPVATRAGEWGGELDTATKQAALYFLTARADEARAVVLELLDTANRDSLARVSAPMLNSSLLPKPDKADGASPLMIPGPPGPQGEQGPQGPKGDPQTPSDATPQMDGTGAAGTATTYARGDHVHPSDTSKLDASGLTNANGYLSAAGLTTASSVSFGDSSISAPMNSGAALTDNDITDSTSALGVALAAKANAADLATVATTGSYADLTNTPTIPAAQVNADWSAASGVAAILNKPTIPTSETWTFVVDDGQGGTTTVTKSVAVYAGAGA